MKKIILPAVSLFLFVQSQAQTQLSFESNALQQTDRYSILHTKIENPGNNGKFAIWDFSDIICESEKLIDIISADNAPEKNLFPDANIVNSEEGERFYFKVNEKGNNLLGFVTENAIIKYDNPVERTHFPFAFGDETRTNYTGTGLYYDVVQTLIWGQYHAHADALGTLLLPGGIALNNVLRIKTTDNIYDSGCKLYNIKNTKYLWYAENFRYPIVVFLEKIKIDGKDTTITYSGFYNQSAIEATIAQNIENQQELTDDASLFQVYPNPYAEEFHIRYNLKKSSRVNIEIVNTAGAVVLTLADNESQTGEKNYTVKSKNIARGTYFVKIMFDDRLYMRKVVRVD